MGCGGWGGGGRLYWRLTDEYNIGSYRSNINSPLFKMKASLNIKISSQNQKVVFWVTCATIFQKFWRQFKICNKKKSGMKFHTENPQILGTTVQNLAFRVTWHPRFLRPRYELLHWVKVKWSRYRSGVAHKVGRGIALLFHDRSTRRKWVVSSTRRPHFSPWERPGTHFTGDWVDPRAGLDGRKLSSQPGFDPLPSSP